MKNCHHEVGACKLLHRVHEEDAFYYFNVSGSSLVNSSLNNQYGVITLAKAREKSNNDVIICERPLVFVVSLCSFKSGPFLHDHNKEPRPSML